MKTIAAAQVALVLASAAAWGQTYRDGPTADWFKSLSSPYVRNCCDQADCKLAEADFRAGEWWAKSNRTGEWVRIAPGNITETVSIFPKAVLCEGEPVYSPADGHYEARVFCFAPPPIGF